MIWYNFFCVIDFILSSRSYLKNLDIIGSNDISVTLFRMVVIQALNYKYFINTSTTFRSFGAYCSRKDVLNNVIIKEFRINIGFYVFFNFDQTNKWNF